MTPEEIKRLPRVACSGCGKPIVWALAGGKRIPLDPRPACYLLDTDGPVVTCERRRAVMVSHFATCPDATRFSGGGKT